MIWRNFGRFFHALIWSPWLALATEKASCNEPMNKTAENKFQTLPPTPTRVTRCLCEKLGQSAQNVAQPMF
jgi:hypothetical protein